MIRAIAFRGSTAWEAQIGRLWVRIKYPRYWLFSRSRHGFVRSGHLLLIGPQRGWLFAWPGSIGWDRDA